MKNVFSMSACILVFLFSIQTANSNTYIDQMMNATENTIELALEKYETSLNSQEGSVVDSIKFSVDRFDWNVYGTRAQIENGNRGIILTKGLIMALDAIDRSFVEGAILQLDTETVINYAINYAKDIKERSRRHELGYQILPPYPHFCQVHRFCNRLDYTSEEYEGLLVLTKIASVSFVIAHEIGHHVLDHLENSSTKSVYEIETEADNYALNLMVRSRISPLPALPIFVLFGSLKIDNPIRKNQDIHPNPWCRAMELIKYFLDNQQQHPSDLEITLSQKDFERFERDLESIYRSASGC